MQYEEGPSAGKIEGRTVSNVSSTPQIGMYPVELWEDGSVVHFGNKITALNKVQTAAQTVEPKQTAVDMDSVARAAEQRYAPENNKYADVQALRELDAMPVKDDAVLLKEQADEMMAEAKMHAEQLGLDLPELKQLADIDAKATQYAKAVKAAAVCGIRG
jgi:transcriptional regulator of met regulon